MKVRFGIGVEAEPCEDQEALFALGEVVDCYDVHSGCVLVSDLMHEN